MAEPISVSSPTASQTQRASRKTVGGGDKHFEPGKEFGEDTLNINTIEHQESFSVMSIWNKARRFGVVVISGAKDLGSSLLEGLREGLGKLKDKLFTTEKDIDKAKEACKTRLAELEQAGAGQSAEAIFLRDSIKKLNSFLGKLDSWGSQLNAINEKITSKKVKGKEFEKLIDEKAKMKLGWEPKEDLRSIVKSAWEWHRKNPNGF